jgi:hypothetical protein
MAHSDLQPHRRTTGLQHIGPDTALDHPGNSKASPGKPTRTYDRKKVADRQSSETTTRHALYSPSGTNVPASHDAEATALAHRKAMTSPFSRFE